MGKGLNGKEIGRGITQRKDGIYQARYTDRWGKRQTIYDRNLRTLQRCLDQAKAKYGRYLNTKEEIPLDQWFEIWLSDYKGDRIKENTKLSYTNVYKSDISPYLGGKKINALVKYDIQKLIDTANDKGLGYERKKKIKAIMKDMLQRAYEDDLIIKNPVSGIDLREKKVHNEKVLTNEEQDTFFTYCEGTFYDNLFNVAVYTGLRPGELFALQLNDIDLKEGFIHVNKTLVYQRYLNDKKKTFHLESPKTVTSNRKIPINDECREYLEKQIQLKEFVSKDKPKQQNAYLFVTKFNTPLNSQMMSHAIKVILDKINRDRSANNQFERFSGHTFRHTFSTRCYEHGIDSKCRQSYLGHARPETTEGLYVHVTDERAAQEIKKLSFKKEKRIVQYPAKVS